MKNSYIVAFVSLLFSTNCKEHIEKEIQWNGEIVKGKIELMNGDTIFNDLIRTYDSGGNLVSLTNYVNGKKEGKSEFFFSNGIKSEETYFENDLKNGARKLYDSTGKLIESQSFYFGRPIGDLTIYNTTLDTFSLYKFSNFEGVELYSCFWNTNNRIVELGSFLLSTTEYYLIDDSLKISVFLYLVNPPHKRFRYELIYKNLLTNDVISVFKDSSGNGMFKEFIIDKPKENHIYLWKVDAYYPSENITVYDILTQKDARLILPSSRRG
ncbi:MAG TPA: hypothetical protein PKV73_15070 [Agriterribacter sp.]|nr:hypothetical protein [Chitinophagaceae bacterium]HRP33218.1 hypothetical protein [Agriterribacter sp.]